jgi:penicillin-binding protein 1B
MIDQRRKTSNPPTYSVTNSFWKSLGIGCVLFGALASGAWIWWSDKQVRLQFEGRRWALPARVFARPLDLYPGRDLRPQDLLAELESLGYRKSTETLSSGQYRLDGSVVAVATRGFAFADTQEPARQVSLHFDAQRIAAVQDASNRPIALMRLEPLEFGKIYPVHNEDRELVDLKGVPPMLINALIAVEDRNFFRHRGVNPLAMLRALFANLRAGKITQGGSTLTQQLAKNFYLTRERTLTRKLNEFLMAVLLEIHYSKQDILEAYLNEIYLGQDGPRSVHGFGLAAQFYFGRPLAELKTHELALLAGLARGASLYDPRRHPDRALKRRNIVLRVMQEQGVLNNGDFDRMKDLPLQVLPKAHMAGTRYPAFMDLVRRQLQHEYAEDDLRSQGLRIFSSLDPITQRQAEQTLRLQLDKLERQRGLKPETLEGAVVVTGSASGEIQAMVGGRDPEFSGFNRVLDAKRQIGSLMKPAVYLTALLQPQRYNVLTRLDDAPIRLRDQSGRFWSPENYTHESHGLVPMYEALAHSYNQATVRLGMDLGLANVRKLLRTIGVDEAVPEYPSVLLGTVDLTPMQVTQMYQTFAAGGFVTPLRAIRTVVDREGRTLTHYGITVRQAYDPAYGVLLHKLLSEVINRGTAREATAELRAIGAFAGKTGTTNELRDSWFAGYGGKLLSVVWVGRDDNAPAGFTGATGALRIWTGLMRGLATAPLDWGSVPGVDWAWVDPIAGVRTESNCSGAERWPFISGYGPQEHVSCKPPENSFDAVKDLFQ